MQNNSNLTIPKIEQISNSVQLLYLKVRNGEIELNKISLLNIIEDYLTYLLTTHSESINLEIVANFLVEISELILWKSNLLLPLSQKQIEEEIKNDTIFLKEDYWIEYKKYQSLVKILAEKEFKQREIYLTCFNSLNKDDEIPQENSFSELIFAIESILVRNNSKSIIDFENNEVNIVIKMEEIEENFLKNKNQLTFSQMIYKDCPKIEIIIIFLALLQLICQGKVDYIQSQNFGEILFYRKEDKKLKKKNTQ